MLVLASYMIQAFLREVKVAASVLFLDTIGAARKLLRTFDSFSPTVWTTISRVFMGSPCLSLWLDHAWRSRHLLGADKAAVILYSGSGRDAESGKRLVIVKEKGDKFQTPIMSGL